MTKKLIFLAILLVLGTSWGLTQPLTKMAVSTGYGAFGLIMWQAVIMAATLWVIVWWQGKSLPFKARHLSRYVAVAVLGTLLPNSISYTAAFYLPSGILSILISLVPMFTLPIALGLGMERFNPIRVLGVFCGAIAMVLLVGPENSLPVSGQVFWTLVASLSALCYASEGIWVTRYGRADLDPIQLIMGASVVTIVLSLPIMLLSGQYISPFVVWGEAEWALVLASIIHALVYSGYVWLLGRAGVIFAGQVSYIVTASGIVWAIVLLGESYSGPIWGALAIMMFGLFLVQPRNT